MKKFMKIITMFILCAIMLTSALPVSAMTTQIIIRPSYEEDSALSVMFDDGKPMTEYIYTGEVITPKLEIRKMDGSIPSPDEYSVEYAFNSDSKSVGAHHVLVTYLKNGYEVMLRYDIVPGKTDNIDVKVKDGQVTVSWDPVPGAGVYRVYKYNEETGRYSEMWWSADEIAAPKTSRTFTEAELEPGGKYKMAIMALPAAHWMPTKQMAYFTVDTTKDTDSVQKPVTTAKPVEKTTNKANKPATTVNLPETTTVGEETGTTLPEESTTAIPDSEAVYESVAQTLKTDEDNVNDTEKDNSHSIKLGICVAVIILAGAGIVFAVYKKKK